MKQLFLLLFITASISISKAQVVSIPDSVFLRSLINQNVDANNDGLIQQGEALAVTTLYLSSSSYCYNSNGSIECRSYPIQDLTGIRSFTNLQTLNVNNDYENLQDLSPQRGIQTIDLTGLAHLTSLNIVRCIFLHTLRADGCMALQSLSIGDYYAYPYFDMMDRIDSLDLHGLTNLKTVYCDKLIRLHYLNLSNCTSLQSIYLREPGDYPTGTDFTTLTNLKTVDMNGYMMGSISTGLGNYDFSNLRQLKRVSFTGTVTTPTVKFANNDSLTIVDVENMRQSQQNLDFSTCTRLSQLVLVTTNTAAVNFDLSLKNGSALTQFQFYVWNNYSGNILNICADDFEQQQLRQQLIAHGYTGAININSYCSFYPGGNYNTIAGKLGIDNNNNGCDNSDRPLVNVPVKFTDTTGQSATVFSNGTGDYSMFTYKGLFSFQPYLPYPYFSLNPASGLVSFDTANSLVNTTNFCLQPNGVHNDLEINFLPGRGGRPGFNAAYILAYRNRGNTTLSGAITLNFDDNKLNFVSASVAATTQNTGQLVWNYSNLLPLETRTISITFYFLPPPINNINDTVTYLASITPFANDETAFDNSFILPQRLTGSYDPNEKQCLEGSKLDISKIGEYLHYMIHFQNEGTDTAFNIAVIDTLSDKLDWSSFEFTAASHHCYPILKNNKAEFYFPDINLPYKAIDEPGSNGWVAFKIKPRPTVLVGDSLKNRASIYFDFNLPVITNRATTVITSPYPLPVKLEYFSVNKKNNTNLLNWKANCTYGNATFVIERSNDGIHFSSIGNINATSLRCQLPFNFTDNDPAAGKNYYRLKITDAERKNFYSKTLVVGNNKAGLEITAVSNNTLYLNGNKQQIITVKVIAADGKEILHHKQMIAAGNNNISLQMKNTAVGIYTLIIYTTNGEVITKKFVQ